MKFTAAGNIIIQRRIQDDFVGFEELAPFIKQGDALNYSMVFWDQIFAEVGDEIIKKLTKGGKEYEL